MAPKANISKRRGAKGTATTLASSSSDSDDEYHAYYQKLQEASNARIRLEKAKEIRNMKRKELADAHKATLSDIQNRIQKSVALYQDTYAKMHVKRLQRLLDAIQARDKTFSQLEEKIGDLRQIMKNHGVQLRALYQGRHNDMMKLLKMPPVIATKNPHGTEYQEKVPPNPKAPAPPLKGILKHTTAQPRVNQALLDKITARESGERRNLVGVHCSCD
ncbi:hypothetical protein B0H63DRAFT_13868 [Podospora didyma]|uniref:Uncharacterized protein n=1 Tax=Podospora didyma TaxID=330526 RepID=A0AAE0P4N3_9PEZI|nr:hypothetical protein B0H63DRAFT_13868 [Podospora didyma]